MLKVPGRPKVLKHGAPACFRTKRKPVSLLRVGMEGHKPRLPDLRAAIPRAALTALGPPAGERAGVALDTVGQSRSTVCAQGAFVLRLQ